MESKRDACHLPKETGSNQAFDVVVPSKVIKGLDRRTMLMLRNIPNNTTRDEFVAIVEQTPGCIFDQLKLPIDRRSGRNRGYAFVNLDSVDGVLEFWRHWNGRTWGEVAPDSHKKCQVGYATEQKSTSG